MSKWMKNFYRPLPSPADGYKQKRVLHIGGTLLSVLRPPTRPLVAFLQIRHKQTLFNIIKPSEGRVELQDNKQNTRSNLQHINQFLILSFRMQNQPFVDSTMPIYL